MLDEVTRAPAAAGQNKARDTDQWTRKFGYVVPSWNTVNEYETIRMLPSDVSAHFSRIAHTEDSASQAEYMLHEFPSHLKLLLHADVNAICFACTAATFYNGRAKDVEYLESMTNLAKRPVVSMAGALVDAAKHMNLSRIAVGAPYEEWALKLLVRYLEESGFKIANAIGLGEQANVQHPPEAAVELAIRACSSNADGLILSCANFRTLEVIDEIERRLKKPLITSNQASLWSLLSKTNWRGSIAGAGKLFDFLAPRPVLQRA
jgi:maleate isomerase